MLSSSATAIIQGVYFRAAALKTVSGSSVAHARATDKTNEDAAGVRAASAAAQPLQPFGGAWFK